MEDDSRKPKIRIHEPQKSAGGLGAIRSSLKVSANQMGIFRSIRALLKVNQKDGFDCPGCAWPDPDDRRSMTEFCENGAKAVAEEATRKRIGPDFFEKWSVAELCEQSDYWLSQQGRLTHPMLFSQGATHYVPIAWEAAFALIARELRSLSSPDQAIFYTSGRTSNEAAFLYQLFVRLYGTNNLPDCSNMCHESSGVGLQESIGSGKGTVSLKDFEHTDCIFVVGQNPGTNHPRMLTALQAAARRGCKIISINPLAETGLQRFKHPQEVFRLLGRGTPLASLFLPVKINGDVALFKGMMKEMIAAGAIDQTFIADHTTGFEEFSLALHQVSWEEIIENSGISREQIHEAAKLAIASERTIVCWAMGLTQHKNGVANIQEIVNFLLLRGNFGKAGAGACPVRGHSNVQGDRTMGIWEKPTPTFLDALEKEFRFSPPREAGYDVVESIQAMRSGAAKVFFAMGGNFLSATPDTVVTAEALRNCELTSHVSTKLNRSHLICGKQALILPCLGRTEKDIQKNGPQFVSVENSMGIVHSSVGSLAPASEHLLSEVSVVCRLAKAVVGNRDILSWDRFEQNYDNIRDRISKVIPGFEDFNEKVRRPGGFELPHAVRDKLQFSTASGRAHFTLHAIPKHNLAADEFLMMTIRTHDQYNTTIYGLEDRYRGIFHERRVVLMNREDILTAGLSEGQTVDLTSGHTRWVKNFVVVPYAIPKKCVATYFPETNALVPLESYAEKSQTPTYKSVPIRIIPIS